MWIQITLLLLAIPTGYLIAWMAKDELKQGRKWFRILVIGSILGVVWFWLTGKYVISWTLSFIGIVALVSLIKSGKSKDL